jgi:hypothetical protein
MWKKLTVIRNAEEEDDISCLNCGASDGIRYHDGKYVCVFCENINV